MNIFYQTPNFILFASKLKIVGNKETRNTTSSPLFPQQNTLAAQKDLYFA